MHQYTSCSCNQLPMETTWMRWWSHVVLLDKHPKLVEMKIIPHCRNIFQNPIEKWEKESHSLSITHKYMTPHFPGLEQALQWKVPGLNSIKPYASKPPALENWCSHTRTVHMWVKGSIVTYESWNINSIRGSGWYITFK